jgi:nicotinate-nucleotide adenylyltransferase
VAAVKLGVLGGTFDPVHTGHLVLAEQAREQLGLERVLWVPAGDPWRKGGAFVSPKEDRVAMVERAIADAPAFELRRLEVDRPGPSYTVETLAELRELYRGYALVFVLGKDALEDLPRWHEPRRLIELASLGVACRGGDRLTDEALEHLVPGLAKRVAWVAMPHIEISATELRQRAAANRSLRYLVPQAVEAYIRVRGLYRET